MALDVSKPVRVAAVQMDGRVADIPYNLEQAEKLAGEALERGARIVGLPEFFTTPVSFDARLSRCALPPENAALEMMKRLARAHGAYIGGSMLMRKGADVFNTYCFVQPDGAVFTHDKDIPTMWENAFYVGGSDDGVMDTEIGRLGAAVCWELVRTQTVERLRGKIRLAMTGSNWWTGPVNWPLLPRLLGGVERANREFAAEAPIRFARLLGVPVIHAGQAGRFKGQFPLFPGLNLSLPYVARFLGETKIVDGRGRVVARREQDEGAGLALGEVMLEAVEPSDQVDPGSFWIPDLTRFHIAYWHHQNACGKIYYRNHHSPV
ncbi:MAG: carbon-nitrogen hydrolase family protein [Deltaproteobacteria bacterium]|nr:carbon-nitrogen hydrolase family protein [Deltaproteobacteria bacterium]